jgi:hypothetical protein
MFLQVVDLPVEGEQSAGDFKELRRNAATERMERIPYLSTSVSAAELSQAAKSSGGVF